MCIRDRCIKYDKDKYCTLFNNCEFASGKVTCCRFNAFHVESVTFYVVADYTSADVGAQRPNTWPGERRRGDRKRNSNSDFPLLMLDKVRQSIHGIYQIKQGNRIQRNKQKSDTELTVYLVYVCTRKNCDRVIYFLSCICCDCRTVFTVKGWYCGCKTGSGIHRTC